MGVLSSERAWRTSVAGCLSALRITTSTLRQQLMRRGPSSLWCASICKGRLSVVLKNTTVGAPRLKNEFFGGCEYGQRNIQYPPPNGIASERGPQPKPTRPG